MFVCFLQEDEGDVCVYSKRGKPMLMVFAPGGGR